MTSTLKTWFDESIGYVEMIWNILSWNISDIDNFVAELVFKLRFKPTHALEDMGDAFLLKNVCVLGRSDVTDEKSWDDLVHFFVITF